MVVAAGTAYLHAPVMGSTPAIARGGLTILAGGKPTAEVESVLSLLGDTLVFSGAAEAAALKLVANGVLGDSVSSLRRALARGEVLGLPRDALLDVLGRGALGRFVDGRRDVLADGARPAATFAAGALAKDLALLAAASDTRPAAAVSVSTLLDEGAVSADDDITVLAAAAQDLSWLADARLDVSPEVVADADGAAPAARLRPDPRDRRPVVPRRGVPPDCPHRGLPRRRVLLVGPRVVRRRLLRQHRPPTRRPGAAASSASTSPARSPPRR